MANEGVKFDAGKSRIDLVPPELVLQLGDVLGVGASKYGDRNWELGFDWGRPYAAAQRHLLLWSMGQDVDPETGLPHLAHAATNIGFLIAFASRGVGKDDRSPFFKKVQDIAADVLATTQPVRVVDPVTTALLLPEPVKAPFQVVEAAPVPAAEPQAPSAPSPLSGGPVL